MNYQPVPVGADVSGHPIPDAVPYSEEETSVDLLSNSREQRSILPAGNGANNIVMEPDIETSAVAPGVPPVDEVRQYLWNVYQRSSTKFDSHGDFTWKDAAAAARLDMSVEDYVIGGMEPDFREQLFTAGQAMDAAGIDWTILSAFRDDYRQSLAVGLKAHVGNSFHGGSTATGGYGHGCAVDIAGTNSLSSYIVWNWLDQYGGLFGLYRPLRGIDPAHVQPSAGWHDLGITLREQRVGLGSELDQPDTTKNEPSERKIPVSADSNASGLTEDQFNCTRPRPAQEADRPARIVYHLKTLITRLLPQLTMEGNRSKVRWKTAGGAISQSHRMNTRRSPSENTNRHAKLKQSIRLAG
jgi:hypothetical protein